MQECTSDAWYTCHKMNPTVPSPSRNWKMSRALPLYLFLTVPAAATETPQHETTRCSWASFPTNASSTDLMTDCASLTSPRARCAVLVYQFSCITSRFTLQFTDRYLMSRCIRRFLVLHLACRSFHVHLACRYSIFRFTCYAGKGSLCWGLCSASKVKELALHYSHLLN